MKKTTKLLSVVLTVILLAAAVITPASAYAAPTVAIQPNSATATPGANVTITVRYTVSDTDIGAMLGYIEYDETAFEPVANTASGEIQFGAGAGGRMTIQYDADRGGIKTVSGTVTFKSKKVGTATFAVVTNELVNFSIEELTIPAKKTTTVNVQNVQLSSNNNLKTVSISLGGTSGRATVTPAFSAAVTSYTVKVPYDTTSASFDAVVAELGKASYVLEGPWSAPASGDWIRKIVVTAENGSKKTYTFKIVKDAAPTPTPTPDPTPTPEPEPDPEPNDEYRVITGDKEYWVVIETSGIEIPSGFEQNITRYNNVEIPCFTTKDGAVTLVLLEDNEGNTKFFRYDEYLISFADFDWTEVASGKYIFANAAEYTTLVNDLESLDIKIGETVVTAYKLNSNQDFVLVWAIAKDGIGKLYVYDVKENTIQRYSEIHGGELSGNQTNSANNPEPLKKTVSLYHAIIVGGVMLLIILVLIIAWLSSLGRNRRIIGSRKEFDFVPFMDDDEELTRFASEAVEQEETEE